MERYKAILPEKLVRLEPRLFSEALFRAVGMGHDDFRFGMTKVFFRAGKFAEFDQIMRSDPENLLSLVERVNRWLVCKRWKKVIYGAISVQKLARKIQYRADNAVIIQRCARMYLALHKHRPRYRGLMQLRKLRNRTPALTELASMLKRDKQSLVKRVTDLETAMDQQVNVIKGSVMSQSAIDQAYNDLLQQTEQFLMELQSRQEQQRVEEEEAEKLRKIKEEQEHERRRREEEAARLRKLQEEMERERKRKEEEERRRKQEEEERRKRAELEARRLREEEERRRLEEERRKKEEQEEADRKLATGSPGAGEEGL